MQIITISPSRKSQQVWLKFDDNTLLPLKVDDIVRLKIVKFTDISNESYQVIQHASACYLLLEYALRQVAISPKVEQVIRQKLKEYCRRITMKYSLPSDILPSIIEDTISRLVDDQLLDEAEYVRYLVKKFPKKSSSELVYLLRRLGVKHQLPVNSDVEKDKILSLINKKYRSIDLTDYIQRNKLISRLSRKGFPIEFIKSAIDESIKVR